LNYGARYASSTLRFPRETYVNNYDQIYPRKRGKSLIHDLRAAWGLDNGVEVYLGINNVLDEDPPRGASESQSLDRGYFDPIGRFFYSGVQVRL
jgi:outer membrane receptor protein involved in Fe transport